MKQKIMKLFNRMKKNKMNNQVTVLESKKVNSKLNDLVSEMKESTWKRSDIDFDKNICDLSKLDNKEKSILFMMCGFFLTINSVVIDSLNDSLIKDLEVLAKDNKQVKKALEFYREQNRQEQVHDEFYKDIAKAFFSDKYNLLQKSYEDFSEFKKVFNYCRKF